MTVKLLIEHHFEFLSLKGGCKAHLSLHLSKCHIVGNLMSKLNSCIDFYSYSCLHPLSNERISMFKSGDSRADIADQTDHFADVFVRENVA